MRKTPPLAVIIGLAELISDLWRMGGKGPLRCWLNLCWFVLPLLLNIERNLFCVLNWYHGVEW